MPVYEYRCSGPCGQTLEVERGITDAKTEAEAAMRCPSCGGMLRRVFGASVVIPEHMRAGGKRETRRIATAPGRPKPYRG